MGRPYRSPQTIKCTCNPRGGLWQLKTIGGGFRSRLHLLSVALATPEALVDTHAPSPPAEHDGAPETARLARACLNNPGNRRVLNGRRFGPHGVGWVWCMQTRERERDGLGSLSGFGQCLFSVQNCRGWESGNQVLASPAQGWVFCLLLTRPRRGEHLLPA